MDKIRCTVKGAVRRGCMCKYVTVGREFCGLRRGECNLQEGAQDEATPVQVMAAAKKEQENE